MPTFKGFVRTDYKRADGTYRVYIRITHGRAHRDRPTPFYVSQAQITKSGKLKDQTIIDKIDDKIRELRSSCDKIGFVSESLDIDHLIRLIEDSGDKINFIKIFEDRVSELHKDGRHGTANSYNTVLSSLKNFSCGKAIYLSDMTSDLVCRYYDSISNLSDVTKRLYIGIFHAMYNRVQKKYNDTNSGVAIVRYGIFDNIELPKVTPKKDNSFKTVSDMQKVIDVAYTGNWWIDYAKDMFILSFVCFGTNIADWMSMTNDQYKDGIISYRRKKTGRLSKDNVDIKIKVPDVGKVILDKYSGDSKHLINTFGHRRSSDVLSRYIHHVFLNAGIDDFKSTRKRSNGSKPTQTEDRKRAKYTFYANRHTMASFARNICKIDYMTVMEMLNHSKPASFKTTDTYIWKDYTPLWEANDKLLALFDWSFYLNQKTTEG